MDKPVQIFRKDYRPPTHLVDQVELHFELDPETTTVRSTLAIRRNPAAEHGQPLVLNGRDLELVEISLNGRQLAQTEYLLNTHSLTIPQAPDSFRLEITTRVHPAANTALEGLYQSGEILCTQCEAHGFSRITYFPDRPDVMARYRVTLSADRKRYPVLLANGNPVASGTRPDGRHWVTWEDPFPKPCYLFAVVAGDLALVEDVFATHSGRRVALRIYVEPENRGRCAHAMVSLKQAMHWDEDAFGREYDLDIFMIVAVGSFNMGAMENKGLNIFNAKYIIADPQTATDADHEAVRDIIGHEYFHNWTGNRVTCRDWFQLSVKESLTVFREQQFSAATSASGIGRIDQVRLLRTQQFAEDSGPTAHPVRPESYIEVNNFYTLTVYEKGAEVIRMIHTLLGADGFRRGMDLYFERHDGQAVTIEDFLKAMEDASGQDLGQFRLWYSQAGTPVLKVRDDYDPVKHQYRLTVEQGCPPTPGQPEKAPMHIPLRMGLLGPEGVLPFAREGGNGAPASETLLHLRKPVEHIVFHDVPARPTPALLRGFSAPVRIEYPWTDEQLRRLMTRDPDAFCRWDASQQLLLRRLKARVEAIKAGTALPDVDDLAGALALLLEQPPEDPALLAEMLQLPSEGFLADQFEPVAVDAIVLARDGLRRELASRLAGSMLEAYRLTTDADGYRFEATAVARRRLRNACLGWIAASGEASARELCLRQYHAADNMTDVLGALTALNDQDCPERGEALEDFRRRWERQPLVLDKWLTLQATSRLPQTINTVHALLRSPVFELRNPNRVRALLGAFCQHNLRGLHRADGAGHALAGDQILALDRLNPQVAARLVTVFARWRRFGSPWREGMQAQLQRILAAPGLSPDVYEIVSKSLA